MQLRSKGNAFYGLCLLIVPLVLLLTHCLHASSFSKKLYNSIALPSAIIDTPPAKKPKLVKNKRNTIAVKNDSTKVADTASTLTQAKNKTAIETKLDTPKVLPNVDTLNIKIGKDTLTEPIEYHAEDSLVMDVPNDKMYLYGKSSNVKYQGNNLSAPEIQYDQKKNTMSAYLKKDSAGKVIDFPFYGSADFMSVNDTIVFNMKTGKGITKGSYTKQGELFIYGEKIKKADSSTFYVSKTKFTTCNLDTPHFAFVTRKAKFINQKWAYTGPVHPEFEGVPVPITLPFGIFPLKQGRRSGLLAPTYATDLQRGLGLDGLGYYKIISPNWDVITRGSIYSYGSWNVLVNPRYFKKYKYQGAINLNIMRLKPLDEPAQNTFSLQANHAIDAKARPGVTLTANINVQSTKFNRQVPNSPQQNFNNQLGSTISYARTFKNRPYTYNIAASHNQNNATGDINISFPTGSFALQTQYPFRSKNGSATNAKWYENLGIGYNGSVNSSTTFNDSIGNAFAQLQKNLNYGFTHDVPIALSLPPLGVLQVTPGISFSESWYQNKFEEQYNRATKKMDTIQNRDGLFTARQVAFSISATTRIFGMFGFKPKSRVSAMRHEIRPQIGLNYTPNTNKNNYYFSFIDSFSSVSKSYYANNRFGTVYGNQRNGGMSFSLDNIVSAKIRNKNRDTSEADKKINLIEGFNIATSYNFLADSFKLSAFTLSFRTTLFEKLNISAGGSLNPYQRDANTFQPINRFVWKDKFSIGTLTSANINMSTSFKGGDKNKKSIKERLQDRNATSREAQLSTADINEIDNLMRSNPAEFVDFEIPWNIDLTYSLNYTKQFGPNPQGKAVSQSTTFNGSINLTPRWKIGGQGAYDITNKQLGQFSMFLSRELHCWQMAINISPVGRSKFFNFTISPKSSILRDIKVNRTRSFNEF
jgi:LPS-assembly protein